MTGKPYGRALVWFRRDLRDFDHAALHAACESATTVYCAFVFDREILDPLEDRADRRVEFILSSVAELDARLASRGGALIVRHGHARTEVPALAAALQVDAVYANHDYEPAAIARDDAVQVALAALHIEFETRKDQVVFERGEVVTRAGTPFSVFTPYLRAWLARLSPADLAPHPGPPDGVLAVPPPSLAQAMPALSDLGFRVTDLHALRIPTGMAGGAHLLDAFSERIDRYAAGRDVPAADSPSHLSVHLRFGTVSIRALVRFAHERSLRPEGQGAATWLKELVWREFLAQLLWHHPRLVDHAFRPEYDALPFRNDLTQFRAWCEGRTGYPFVDAGMRELLHTGYMHNRLRMITASFLVKDLLLDWRWGERHFARRLIDYDLASNNGGWQWVASTGCDAQPWFRIMSPVAQSERFDSTGAYIRRHVPELAGLDDASIHAPWRMTAAQQQAAGVVLGRDYPPPIVDHAQAREAALALFGRGNGQAAR